MNPRVIIGLAAVLLAIGSAALLLVQPMARQRAVTPVVPASSFAQAETARASDAGTESGAATAPSSNGPMERRAAAFPGPSSIDLGAPVDAAQRVAVVTALAQLSGLYTDAGTLDWHDTKALVAKRRQAVEELVNALAKLGPGGARAIANVYAESQDTRAKLVMLAALGRIDDGETSAVLNALLQRDDSFSVRKEMVAALGKRQESDSGAVLAALVQNQEDARLRAAGVQALSGRPEALSTLNERIRTDPNQDVRLESIHVAGSLDTPAAQDLLAGIAKGSMDLVCRQKAIQELARTSGERALEVFHSLLSDADENIRQTAVKAMARLHTDRSVALLRQTATSDSSLAIRELARLALPTPTVTE